MSAPASRPVALGQPSVMQPVHEGFGDFVAGGDLAVGETFDDNGLDQNLRFRHPSTLAGNRSQ